MQNVDSLNEFTAAEKELLIGYVMACLYELGNEIQIVEHKAAPNILLHYAVHSATASPLSKFSLDKLPAEALNRRDQFKALLATLNIPLQSAAIVIQFHLDRASLGVINRNVYPWNQIQPTDEAMTLDFYLGKVDNDNFPPINPDLN